jgi:hypothetical protein
VIPAAVDGLGVEVDVAMMKRNLDAFARRWCC